MSSDKQPSVEDKIVTLEQAVAWFDSDEFVLEQALEKYQSAEKLAAEIQQDIAQLKNTIEQVGKKAQ